MGRISPIGVWVVAILLMVGGPSTARATGPAETWTSRTSAADDVWSSVTYADGVFVAVARSGSGGRVMTSPDGVVWTARTGASSSAAWHSVAHGAGRFVAVGFENGGPVTQGRVMTSLDGVTWTASDNIPDGQWFSVAYGDGVFVAVATSSGRAMTSPDGLTWELKGAAPTGAWQEVVFGSAGGVPTFVAVSYGGAIASTDRGDSWTAATGPTLGSADWISVAYGDGRFVAVPDGGAGVAPIWSVDGVAWTAGTTVFPHYWESVTHGEGVFVAVGYSQSGPLIGTVMTSPDGDVWTARTAAMDRKWTSVTFARGLFVAVAESGTGDRVMTSGVLAVATAPPAVTQSTLVLSCVPVSPTVGNAVTCTVAGGDPDIDILWSARYPVVISERGVTLDAAGTGTFSFVVPAAALGEELTVELVEWLAPASLGVVGGPVPGSVPAGEGPVPLWPIVLAALFGVGLLRRGMRAQA